MSSKSTAPASQPAAGSAAARPPAAATSTSTTAPSPASADAATTAPTTSPKKLPTCVLLVGMAGSGKTSVMQRMNAHLLTTKQRPYIVNLDPAVTHVPYAPNIDIRDTVKYAEVMKQYQLGPNGAILTSLNLFTTKFDQVLDLLEKRQDSVDYILIDTPGQIEVFTWSASGSIITDSLAATYPTVVAFVVDTPRSASPATFMSNMLYACSILYRTRLPFVVLFNKSDVTDPAFAIEWMRDFEAFQSALHSSDHSDHEPPYMHSLVQSMSLVLDEFYSILDPVSFSAVTGLGAPALFEAFGRARDEYFKEYKPELERLIQEREKRQKDQRQRQMEKLMRDIKLEEAQGAGAEKAQVDAGAGASAADQEQSKGKGKAKARK
ncbi:GPN-loop GTPase 1 [Allomyces javanicus]|nr:GPN-loop GTPase 1 [Allomyces javanicus]